MRPSWKREDEAQQKRDKVKTLKESSEHPSQNGTHMVSYPEQEKNNSSFRFYSRCMMWAVWVGCLDSTQMHYMA